MNAYNVRNGKELSGNVIIAEKVLERMRGLLGREGLQPGESLWIKPCNSVHTIGMRFPIDVIFLDMKSRVVAVKKNLLPNRITRIYFKAASVLELPCGIIDDTLTDIGDEIAFINK